MVPTIVNEVKDRRALARPAFAYLDSAQRKSCEGTVASIEGVADTLRDGLFHDFLSEIGEVHRAGIGILAGTDVPNPCLAPGFSLHDELGELVAAGLSPRAALAAATISPARFLRATDSLGTVSPGKLADLVLLDGDPLIDIGNSRRIRAVFLDGSLFTRAELDTMLVDSKPR
jgi:imidazolonepropionase-like amidohydrolase